jgi:hypothetical protein
MYIILFFTKNLIKNLSLYPPSILIKSIDRFISSNSQVQDYLLEKEKKKRNLEESSKIEQLRKLKEERILQEKREQESNASVDVFLCQRNSLLSQLEYGCTHLVPSTVNEESMARESMARARLDRLRAEHAYQDVITPGHHIIYLARAPRVQSRNAQDVLTSSSPLARVQSRNAQDVLTSSSPLARVQLRDAQDVDEYEFL